MASHCLGFRLLSTTDLHGHIQGMEGPREGGHRPAATLLAAPQPATEVRCKAFPTQDKVQGCCSNKGPAPQACKSTAYPLICTCLTGQVQSRAEPAHTLRWQVSESSPHTPLGLCW